MKKIYLSGPMSGLPDHNIPAFHAMAAELRAAGYEVVNPAELNVDPTKEWEACMRTDISELCTCDAIALMPGWERSSGANLELHIAHRLGLEVMHLPIGFDLVSHLQRQIIFSTKTFGPGQRTEGVLDHIRKELIEIEEAPDDLEEWIDVVMLALDGAWRAGYSPEAIAAQLMAKQEKNERRQWPDWRTAEPGKAIEHLRDDETDAA